MLLWVYFVVFFFPKERQNPKVKQEVRKSGAQELMRTVYAVEMVKTLTLQVEHLPRSKATMQTGSCHTFFTVLGLS